MSNLVQFLYKSGFFSENREIIKKSEQTGATPGVYQETQKPAGGEIPERDEVKALAPSLTGENAPALASTNPNTMASSAIKTVSRDAANNPSRKPTENMPSPARISRIPKPITNKIAGIVYSDSLATMCSHCLDDGERVSFAKRANSLFPSDSGWQFVCDREHGDENSIRTVSLERAIEKNAYLEDIIQEPEGSVFVVSDLKQKLASVLGVETRVPYRRDTGIDGFSNPEDVEILNKLGYELDYNDYSDLPLGPSCDVYSYIEKVAGVPRDVSKAISRKEAFSGEYLKDMGYDVPKGYEVKGDLVCPIEKTAEKPGLWANIRAKRARGEKAAKPGDEDYPDKKTWKKLTSK